MQLIVFKKHPCPKGNPEKAKRQWRALLLSLLAFFIIPTAFSQAITLDVNNVPVEQVFRIVQQQTGYSFVYTKDQLQNAAPVTAKLTNVPLSKALESCLKEQPFTWIIHDRYIVLKDKEQKTEKNTDKKVTGIVLNEDGEPVAGATVTLKQTGNATVTNDEGMFALTSAGQKIILLIVAVGYVTSEETVSPGDYITVHLTPVVHRLDETLVIAYGKTTRRLSTGSVSKVAGADINRQPVPNLLNALHGRVPGLLVTQQTGVPGAGVRLQIRGRTSINDNISNDPLFIIDGVPFAAGNGAINLVGSAVGNAGISPFNTINPADIESIEVLKDADATAIYGSRGANGVILITTKKAKEGKTQFNLNFQTGISTITRTMRFMNTEEYLQMRKEAFANDGLVPSATPATPGYAPDLKIWDTARFTDFKKLLIGNTATTTDLQLSLTGGSAGTQFLVSSGFFRQTTVYPGELYNNRGSLHVQLTHRSTDKKFSLSARNSYVYDYNNINITDLATYMKLPPNLPSLYDSTGKLNWQQGGVSFDNPLAHSMREYEAKTENLLTNLLLNYKITKDLSATTSIGLNSVKVIDRSATPIAAQNPSNAPTGNAAFGRTFLSTVILEPQLNYRKKIGKLSFETTAGATIQRNKREALLMTGTGYTNDNLLHSLKAAPTITPVTDERSEYRYVAAFGRILTNYDNRYILNLTGRRDGSSRFGPGKQFAVFGSAGFAWIFSNESFAKKNLPFISFGKLRMSYGTTGNDKIGDYAYLNTYSVSGVNYSGVSGTVPTSLYNADYAWELNRKLELAAELNFLKDKVQLTATYYLNRSGNQLINYTLPSQTGGQSIIANFPALVENKGVEFEMYAAAIQSKNFSWTSGINISFPKNALLEFPGFTNSSYNSYLVLGQPLNITGGYRFAGVNPSTGIFEFYDRDGKRTSTPVFADRIKDLVKLDPEFFGGITNRITIGNLELNIFIEFRKQTGMNFIGNVFSSTTYPGTMNNQPIAVMNRWQGTGDLTAFQRFTTRSGTPAYNAANVIRLNGSDVQYSDASYARLKNIAASWSIKELARILKIQQIRVYLQAQNALTITKFNGGDPETKNLFRLPPLKTFTAGLQLTF